MVYGSNCQIFEFLRQEMKIQLRTVFCLLQACFATSLGMIDARAFSLLGPYEDWMTPTNGFQLAGGVGGPMILGAEYRWNVPVLTYSFDQSFLDFFGSNGVAAVESAIQILNNLPPASQLDPATYPLDTSVMNYQAMAEDLIDLKSEALFLLLQQLGLAQPQRFMFCVHDFSVTAENTNATIVLRNFDPFSLAVTNVRNGTLYTSNLTWQISNGTQVDNVIITAVPVNPLVPAETAVADGGVGASPGSFYTGLTEDDVGGLRYLLQTNNYNFETLLPDVHGAGTNADNYVNLALRGGADKITFVREALDPILGEFFTPVTNQFTDTYITNGMVMQQEVARVISRPDILFAAADLNPGIPYVPLYSNTGTTHWINNAALNGNPSGPGPGVIQPPIAITFNKLARQLASSGNYSDTIATDLSQFWGSFDASTNAPIVYPISQSGSGQTTVRMWLTIGSTQESFEWMPVGASGAAFAVQTSTDLANWMTLFTVTNNGSVCTYFVYQPASTKRFYRLVPQ